MGLRFCFFVLLIGSVASVSGQVNSFADSEKTSNIYKGQEELSTAQTKAWDSIYTIWLRDDYLKCKKENKIDLNCDGHSPCESFYIDVILKIDGEGKMEYYKLQGGIKCGRPITKPLELRLMRSFFKMEFPPELRNIKFEVRLGAILKC